MLAWIYFFAVFCVSGIFSLLSRMDSWNPLFLIVLGLLIAVTYVAVYSYAKPKLSFVVPSCFITVIGIMAPVFMFYERYTWESYAILLTLAFVAAVLLGAMVLWLVIYLIYRLIKKIFSKAKGTEATSDLLEDQ